MTEDNIVYLGLGGNVGDTYRILKEALQDICLLQKVSSIEVSSFYKTKPIGCIPIGCIPQDDYLNAVCRLKTNYSLNQLVEVLQAVEKKHGKVAKPKNCPRKIDIDILFFNDVVLENEILNIPHLRWKERLFILVPLLELIGKKNVKGPKKGPFGISCDDLESRINGFSKAERKEVIKLMI